MSLKQQAEETDIFSLESIVSVIRYSWLWILICALAGSVAAFYVAAKMGYSFEKTSRIMLRDEKQKNVQPSDFVLSELGLASNNVNIANESYVVKSTELMGRVVEDLKLNISYWQKYDIRQVDIYNATPVCVEFPEIKEQRSCELVVTPLDSAGFSLSYEGSDGAVNHCSGIYNSPLTLPFAVVVVRPTSLLTDKAYGVPVAVRRSPVREVASAFLSQLNVTRPDAKETSLLELKIKTSHPAKAADILNHLVKVYNEQSRMEKTQAAKKAEQFIRERVALLGGDLELVDGNIFSFKEKGDILMDANMTIGANYANVKELEKEMFDISTQIKLVNTLQAQLSNRSKSPDILSVNIGIDDVGISGQIEKYNEAYLKYKQLSASAGDSHPDIKSLEDNMASIRESMRRSISNYTNNLILREKEVGKKKDEVEKHLVQTASQEKELAPFIREKKVKEELYLMLLGKREENALTLATAEDNARVLEYAFGSDAPVAPKTRLFLMAGAGGGAGVCLFAFLILATLDNKVKNRQDIQNLSEIPVVAEFPPLSRRETKDGALILKEERSVPVECFHILRNNIELLLPGKNDHPLSILVTSTMSGEGKTFTSSNLAVSFGKTGKRVLLIDGDLRKGGLTKRLEGKGLPGLSNLLVNHGENPDVVIAPLPGSRNVDILFTGPLPPNPVPLLTQRRYLQLMEYWKGKYDRIVVDGCPFGILADASIMARHADVTLYVIRSGMVDKRFMPSVQQLADDGKIPNAAFLLNDVDFKRNRYHYYGYGYYYGVSRKSNKVK